jgi:hypothetical protein
VASLGGDQTGVSPSAASDTAGVSSGPARRTRRSAAPAPAVETPTAPVAPVSPITPAADAHTGLKCFRAGKACFSGCPRCKNGLHMCAQPSGKVGTGGKEQCDDDLAARKYTFTAESVLQLHVEWPSRKWGRKPTLPALEGDLLGSELGYCEHLRGYPASGSTLGFGLRKGGRRASAPDLLMEQASQSGCCVCVGCGHNERQSISRKTAWRHVKPVRGLWQKICLHTI